tara:strand:+ start:3925 stop:4653 length:729 start_codon:yes stop_codon:yes gene_type:complete
MIYFLYCDDDLKYYGVYTNSQILKENIKFIKLNYKLDKFSIYQLRSDEFDVEKVDLNKLSKTVSFVNQFKKSNIFVIYCRSTNKFIHYHISKNYLNKMISLFNEENEYSVLEVTLNSLYININSDKKINKVNIKRHYTQEELDKQAELIRNINLLKFQKKRLEENKNEYTSNLELYYKFKNKIKSEEDFVIPELFLEKFKIFTELENCNNLSFEKYLERDPGKFLDNSYNLLFEGGNNLNIK